jgi:lipopolysaccharide/colanic/teichoic acid biosynthesis glycosyltransferase
MAATALIIWLTDGRPVFFRQQRIGISGRAFLLWKFRSMRINNLPIDDVTEIRQGHPLVTPVGQFIRHYKIDELPQLFNVVRGDMGMIGPRPTIIEQVVKYTPFQRGRLSIHPGMTGLSQVSGGIDISWSERIMLDVWYVDHRSIWLDAVILVRTIAVVFFGEQQDEGRLRQARAYAETQGRANGKRTDNYVAENLAQAPATQGSA